MNDYPPKYAFTADAVIINDSKKEPMIALIKRKNDPFKGHYALPGGFVEPNEKVEDACIREAKEETSLDVVIKKIIGIYSDPNRDPRGRVITGAFLCEVKNGEIKGRDDAEAAEWVPVSKINKIDLAFDHTQIIKDAGIL
ncbi:MAG: NUDIX domain-containing protein [Promethearchaeota archaeon]